MKIIITDRKLDNREKWNLIENNFDCKYELSSYDYDGLSTEEIRMRLKDEDDDSVIVSADSRILMFASNIYLTKDLFISYNGDIKNIHDCTSKELRIAHNLFKMYEAGAFKY